MKPILTNLNFFPRFPLTVLPSASPTPLSASAPFLKTLHLPPLELQSAQRWTQRPSDEDATMSVTTFSPATASTKPP